jgi:fatty acid synthase subunit alpha, fungi type
VAQKLKKQVDEIPLSKSVKDLVGVGGKSTLQNEILGDLQQEFASAPEKGEELPLEELGCDALKGETYRLAKEFGQKLINNTREVIGKPPMYKDGALY